MKESLFLGFRRLLLMVCVLLFGAFSSTISASQLWFFDYRDFGPQVAAHKLLGMEWWQWDNHGASDTKAIYPIKIIVYQGHSKEAVAKRFPVNPAAKLDYRYVHHQQATDYLKKQIAENVLPEVTRKLKVTLKQLQVDTKWPGKPFDYILAYSYNLKPITERPPRILKDGRLNGAISGKPFIVTETQQARLVDLLNADTRMLEQGLSKCFFPRHALVFYDTNHQIVAHSEISFQCEAIRAEPPLNAHRPPLLSERDDQGEIPLIHYDRATLQLSGFKRLLREIGVPFFDHHSRQ